ncbi:MAG: DEAD/DEAH box helicase, partial [Cyclobacteriaceae bacterium]
MKPIEVLKRVYGYDHFRPGQEEIINNVLAGKDTLAVLPTGGGKSVCFQVPALMMDGICIVVTPLISLMLDQVYQLNSRGIRADALHSGMGSREIDITLDNCVYGSVHFLYVAPERLKSELFLQRVSRMNV